MCATRVILLVEDDEDDVFLMQRAIEETQIPLSLHVVRTGDEALEYLAGENVFGDRVRFPLPDMVFLDLKLPGRDGFDVLEWRGTRPELKMPIAVLSSSPEDRDMRRARELRADCYLIKPPSKSMLLNCFQQFGLVEMR